MKRFYAATALVTGALAALTLYYRSEPDSFYGIADTKEIVINSESAVEVRHLSVVQGQVVTPGDTLLVLHNPELDLKISQVVHELSVLRTRETTHASLSRSELKQLQAQQQEKADEIRAEISELEAQYNMNRQLVTELRSLQPDRASTQEDDLRNPLKIKIESLKRLLELAQDPGRIYRNRLTDALSSSGDPMIEQAKLLEEELRMLQDERQRLVITSPIDGLVGSVNYKAGEKVSPFQPILTVHAASPSFVRGYIHEDVMSQVAVSQRVMVMSGHDRNHRVEGEVVGVGARIVEYPERLRKRPDILIWGREVTVKLPFGNRFLLGEKVRITLLPTSSGAAKKPTAPALGQHDMKPESVAAAGFAPVSGALEGIEASGLVYLADLGRLLVVHDETKKNPALYLVDTLGKIEEALPIEGLDAIDDMESIAVDGQGRLLVLASQSLTKKGKLPKARTVLARISREGKRLKLLDKASVHEALDRASKAKPTADWAVFVRQAIDSGSLDIEGMTVDGTGLWLGFKAPLLNGEAVILKLGRAESLFENQGLDPEAIAIERTLDLRHTATGTACGIGDLVKTADRVYVVSTGTVKGHAETQSGSHAGELLVYDATRFELEHRHDFKGIKVEGIAVGKGRLYLSVDNGSGKPSQLLEMGVP